MDIREKNSQERASVIICGCFFLPAYAFFLLREVIFVFFSGAVLIEERICFYR